MNGTSSRQIAPAGATYWKWYAKQQSWTMQKSTADASSSSGSPPPYPGKYDGQIVAVPNGVGP